MYVVYCTQFENVTGKFYVNAHGVECRMDDWYDLNFTSELNDAYRFNTKAEAEQIIADYNAACAYLDEPDYNEWFIKEVK